MKDSRNVYQLKDGLCEGGFFPFSVGAFSGEGGLFSRRIFPGGGGGGGGWGGVGGGLWGCYRKNVLNMSF